MTTLLEWLADSTVSLSAVLLLILLLRRPLTPLLGAVAVHRLWLLVPLHLAGLLLIGQPGSDQPAALALTLDPVVIRLEDASSTGLSAWTLVLAVWCIGLGLGLAMLLRDVVRARQLCDNSRSVASLPAATAVVALQHIRISNETETPLVAGLFRPTILIPEGFAHRYDADEQQLILQHEAQHLRRRDNLLNLLARLALAIFWFNPLAYLAHAAYRRDQELSVDALVLQRAGGGKRRTYGRALIKSAVSGSPLALTSSWQSRSPLKERTLMLKFHRATPTRSVAGMVLLAALSAGAFALSTNALAIDRAAQAPRAPLTPLERIAPQYPRTAAEQRLEGQVVMELTIDADGRVQDVSIVESHPEGLFDDAAMAAMEQWRFEPPVLKDGASTVTAVQTLLFELDSPAPAAAPPAPANPAPAVDPAPAPPARPAADRTLSVVPAAWSVAADEC